MIDQVAELNRRGKYDSMAEKPLRVSAGLDLMAKRVRRWINGSIVDVIQLYGPEGVGKTTLLKRLRYMFSQRIHGFDIVIWVSVSNGDATRIHDEIIKQLRLAGIGIKNHLKIFEDVLNVNKILLLLNDLPRDVHLRTNVLFPVNKEMDVRASTMAGSAGGLISVNKYKVIFTTEYSYPCENTLGVSKTIKVERLMEIQALALFQENLGKDIPNLSQITAMFHSLPLILIAVSRTIASKKTIAERKDDWNVLRSQILLYRTSTGLWLFPLQFCYDSLPNDISRTCFIYCALYREDGDINIEELVNLWIGEGFLDGLSCFDEAVEQGHRIIEDLKLACLLENGESQHHVKMRNVIYQRALLIASYYRTRINTFLVKTTRLQLAKPISLSQVAQSISLSEVAAGISSPHKFPNLKCVKIRDSMLKAVPNRFLGSMHLITVLDLSHNSELAHVPVDIGSLVELQYLNLSNTRIRRLPVSLKNLQRLRYLGLSNTPTLEFAPLLVTCFPVLKVLDMCNCGTYTDDFAEAFKVLEVMETLISVKITIEGTFQLQDVLPNAEHHKRYGGQRVQSRRGG